MGLVPVGLLVLEADHLALGDEFVYLRDSRDEAFFHSKVKCSIQFIWRLVGRSDQDSCGVAIFFECDRGGGDGHFIGRVVMGLTEAIDENDSLVRIYFSDAPPTMEALRG